MLTHFILELYFACIIGKAEENIFLIFFKYLYVLIFCVILTLLMVVSVHDVDAVLLLLCVRGSIIFYLHQLYFK